MTRLFLHTIGGSKNWSNLSECIYSFENYILSTYLVLGTGINSNIKGFENVLTQKFYL